MPLNIDIPYRCPNCGDQMKFATLHELRCHLENEHSYQSSRSRRRVNISDFDGRSNHSTSMSDLGRISPLLQRFHADTYMLEEELRKTKEAELNNKKHRAGSVDSLLDIDDSYSPLGKNARKIRNPSSKMSFRNYGLPSRLSRHLDPHHRKRSNRENSGGRQTLRPSYKDDDFFDDSNPQHDIDKHILDELSHKVRNTSELKLSNNNTGDKHLAQSLHALSKEVMIERASQQATAEFLYSANETLYGVEKAAEQRIALQQRVIDNLADQLKEKEKRLSRLMQEMDSLREYQTSLKNANVLNSIDFESKHLQQELAEKQKELDALAKNIERSKQGVSVENLKDQIPEKLSHMETASKSPTQDDNRNNILNSSSEKTFTVFHASENKEPVLLAEQGVSQEVANNDDELKSVKQKAQQLEKDRHSLLLEMQGLLESAAVDNEKLRQELQNQEHKLSRMNLDLKSSKHEQAELLGETHELYHQADVGLTKLKMMLKERDRQLSSVSSALDQARDIQQKLVNERDESLKQAAEREGMYRAMLAANSDQLKTLKDALVSNQESKHTLEMNLRKLNHQLDSKGMEDIHLRQKMENLTGELRRREDKETRLKNEVQRREEKLKKAKSEMERMTNFLRKTTDKETSARMKLEGFISKLLERAEKAESELKALQKDKSKKPKHLKKRGAVQEKLPAQPVRGDVTAPDSEIQPSTAPRNNSEYPSGPGLVASYPQESDPGSRPTFTSVPNSLRPQNPFYLHRPRRQTYNNAASMYSSPFAGEEAFGYGPAPAPYSSGQFQLFQNTPEVDRMMRNVEKQNYLSSYNPVTLKGMDPAKIVVEKDPRHPVLPGMWKEKMDFSIDDDGIMWERHATPSPYNSLRLSASPRTLRGVMNLNPDDTDVAEDISDFVYEDEQKSHDESEDADNILAKSKKPKAKQRGKGNQLQNESSPPHDERRLFLVSEPFPRTTARKNTDDLADKPDHESDGARDVPQPGSSDGSPLRKAKEVQKRVEEWTSGRDGKNSLFSSSGFDADKPDADSDFSTSSYASFKREREPARARKTEITHMVDVEPIRPSQNEKTQSARPDPWSTNKGRASHNLDEPDPASVVEETITVASVSERPTHKFAKEMLKKPVPPQRNRALSGDIYDDQRTNSLPVKRAPEETVVLSQAEMNLRENQENKKGMPKRQISVIESSAEVQGSSMEDDNQYNHELEGDDSHPQRYQDTFLPSLYDDPVTNTSQNPIAAGTEESGVGLVDSPEPQAPARSEVLIQLNQGSDTAANAETPTENDSPDDFARENLYVNESQAVTRNNAETKYPSSEGMSSSEEEGGPGKSRAKIASVASVDASTDTDLEKLSQPGHAHRGFAVRKTTPVVRHVYRKKPKTKKTARGDAAQESLSSADELDSSAKAKKTAAKNMRVALFHIFSYLDTTELLKASLVCQQWRKISRHPALWKSVVLHDRNISSEFLFTLSQWCTKTEYLSLKGLRGRPIKAEEDAEQYNVAIRGGLEAGLERFLSTCQDSISRLDIADCDNILTDKCIWLVSGYCRLLTRLTYNSSMDPIHSQLMWALGGGCPGIAALFVQPQHPCPKSGAMNNRCLLMISQFYRDLQEIGLGGKEFDVGGLMPLVQGCQHLRHVTLEHCMPVTADLITGLCRAGLKQLQSVVITGTTVEAKALTTLQSYCRQLKDISINLKPQECLNDPTNKKEKDKYKKMVKALEGLKSKAAFAKILRIDAAPVE